MEIYSKKQIAELEKRVHAKYDRIEADRKVVDDFMAKLKKGEPVEIHPEADRFRMLDDEEREALKYSIENEGLKNGFVLDTKGRIVDGRNRLNILRELISSLAKDTLARFHATHGDYGNRLAWHVSLKKWEGDVGFTVIDEAKVKPTIAALNVNRRHLSAAELIEHRLRLMKQEGKRLMTKKDASALGKITLHGEKLSTAPGPLTETTPSNVVSIDQIAKDAGTSKKTTARYLKVKAEAPKRAEAILEGKSTIKAEYEKLTRKEPQMTEDENEAFEYQKQRNDEDTINLKTIYFLRKAVAYAPAEKVSKARFRKIMSELWDEMN